MFDKLKIFDGAENFSYTDQSFNQILADVDYRALQGLFRGGKSPREVHLVSHVPKDQIDALIFKTSCSFLPEGTILWLKDHLPQSIFNWFFAVDSEKPLSAIHCSRLENYITEQVKLCEHKLNDTNVIDDTKNLEFNNVMPESTFNFASSGKCESEESCNSFPDFGMMEKKPNNLSQENEQLNNVNELVVSLNAKFDNLEKCNDEILKHNKEIIEINRKREIQMDKVIAEMDKVIADIDQFIKEIEDAKFARTVRKLVPGQVIGIAGDTMYEADDFDGNAGHRVGIEDKAMAEKERS